MPDVDRDSSETSEPRMRLVVVYGGRSAEHEISCISALHVLRSADRSRYDVALVGITSGGRWVDADPVLASVGPGTTALPSPDTLPALGGPAGIGPGVVSAGEAGHPGVPPLLPEIVRATGSVPTVIFPVLHGPHGEDGTVQGLLETAGLAYVGAGVTSSAASMDKGVAKAVLAAAGLPQTRHLVLGPGDLDDMGPGAPVLKLIEAELGWPVFVKPANLGSSIGVSRAVDGPGCLAALRLALRYDEWVVVEEAVSARELEVAILGPQGRLRASAPGEIRPSREFYDFEDKYLLGQAAADVPARLPAAVADDARGLAVAAAAALRVEGLARVDLFWEEGGRGLMVNEVNTMPGMTPASLFPLLWADSGVDGTAVLDELVALALDRRRRRDDLEVRRLPGAI